MATIGPTKVHHGCQIWAEALGKRDWSNVSSLVVLVQEPVWQIYGQAIRDLLSSLPLPSSLEIVPDGEGLKTLDHFSLYSQRLAVLAADRKSELLAIGGGTLGDFCGFLAACYMRGLTWSFVPTTLLAQQDASVGGKVAVNLPQGKNLVGQFWPPRDVYMDSSFLTTLPWREQVAGYMELLKHGVLAGSPLFEQVNQLPLHIHWPDCQSMLLAGLEVKAALVELDPRESGPRKLLNLGHTLAHALETASAYALLHGEAVGMGLIFAGMLGNALGHAYDWREMNEAVLKRLPPNAFVSWNLAQLRQLMSHDKKVEKGVITWVVPARPGQVECASAVEDRLIGECLEQWASLLS
jgi:3-dehydroquinate synthase